MLPYLRQRPHSTKLWMSIYKPNTVLGGQVNDGSIAVGEETITIGSITTGSVGNVRAGQTLLVGSTQGGRDYGKLRIRWASGSSIQVAENSEINWSNGLYLSVIDFYEVWPVFPYYIQSGENVTFYKDKDIAYANQNSDAGMGSLVCMGTHFAGFDGDQIYYTATGTVSVSNQTPITYLWNFEGGTPTGSTSATPGLVTYNTPGHYTTRLTVTTSQGVQDISYRHISIYDRPGAGSNTPILKWEIDNLSGSRDEGGYTAKFKVWENIQDVVDGALVVVFAEDSYGTDSISLGGNAVNRSSIVFAGYILDGSIAYDYRDSVVEFEVGSSTEIMKQQIGLSISLDSVSSPSTWYELDDMDMLKVLYHYFRWHSTLLNNTDLRYVGTNYVFEYFDSEASTLYDAISSFMADSLLGYLICDRQNSLYAEVGPETYDDLSIIPYDIDLLRQDWVEEPEITDRQNREVAYLELSGVAWSGVSTGTWTEYIAAAPGYAMSYYGKMDSQTGLILVDQTDLNILVGNVFAYRNARYPDITMELAGNYRNMDIVPLKRELLTINASDTHKGISFNQKPFHVSSIEWTYLPNSQMLYPVISMHELTQGYPGVTILRPQTPITNYPDLPPIDLPPFPIIPLPTPNPIPPPIVPTPPPDDDITCITDDAAPPSRVYQLWVGGILQSNSSAPSISIEGYLGCYLRKGTANNISGVVVDGYWQKSNDGGSTWEDWLDNNYWGVRSDPVSVDATPVYDPWPTAQGQRTLYFENLPDPFQIYGVELWVDRIGYGSDYTFSPSGSADTFWLLGPYDFQMTHPGVSEQYHTGTVTTPGYNGTGQQVWYFVNSALDMRGGGFQEQGLAAKSTEQSPTVWGTSSNYQPLDAGEWAYHNRANIEGDWSYPIDYVMQGLITGSINMNFLSGYAQWDLTPFTGAYVAETFPAKVFDWAGQFYWVMMNGSPTIYRITVYDMYLFNICFLPTSPGGGYA